MAPECLKCMENADCLGGFNISVHEGYWWRNTTSTNIYKCFKPSVCLGGYFPNETHPVQCDLGYEGILCHWCSKDVEGKIYMRTGDNVCSGCPKVAMNTLRLIGFIILILIYIFILIFFNIRKSKDSKTSTITWILTNYMQTVSASISFNLTYPKLLD